MNNEDIKNIIDDIVWWVPFKKLRNNIRKLLINNYIVNNQSMTIMDNLNNEVNNIKNINYANSNELNIIKNNLNYLNTKITNSFNDKETNFEKIYTVNNYNKSLICTSQLCNQEFFGLPLYQYWCNKILEKPRFHRKQWEFIYIIQTLYENGCLEEGKKGLVFGVGKEPLPALFATMGCKILATDLDCNIEQSKSWIETNQHAQNDINKLNKRNICPDKIFNENVSFMPLNMNEIPDTLKDFDFNWSSCALEHIGGLENSINFIINNLKTLKSGGIAVHTTEYNLSSNEDTFLNPYNIIFRRKDILEAVKRLEDLGHYVYPLDFRQGNYMADNYVDTPPYSSDFHLRLQIDKYVATSIGLIVRKK